MTSLWIVLAFVSQAYGQYARSYNYVGYVDTGGTNRDPEANLGDVETIVMPYKRLTGSEEGYVHGFRVTADVAGQPFRIQIWRRNQGIWNDDGSWQDSYLTQTTEQLDGFYTVVYTTDKIYSDVGEADVYLETGVRVQQNDFLGFSYKRESPFYYDIARNCENDYNATRMTSSSYPAERSWYSFVAREYINGCRTYVIGMLIEFDTSDMSTDRCNRLNVLDTDLTYTLTSHAQYPDRNYDDNMDVCWVVHSYDSDHYLTFTIDDSDSFDIEYYDECRYDVVTFFYKSGDRFIEDGKYCDAVQFPYTKEIYPAASIVKVRFTTDHSDTARGFQFKFRAVDTDYDPSSSDGGSNQQSGASTNNENCDGSNDEWKWRCLSTAEKILLIFVIILLFICIVLFVCCLSWYCCCRPREKVAPQDDDTDHVVLPHKTDTTYSIPFDYEPYFAHRPYTPTYANVQGDPIYEEVRKQDMYRQPKSLRPLSDPLGSEGQTITYHKQTRDDVSNKPQERMHLADSGLF